MDNEIINEEPVKKKRGRKPKNPEDKIYFGEKQESAVIQYITTDDISVRNKIYTSILEPALNKMVESIIRTYTLYVPDEEFEDTVYDAQCYIATILDKFTVGKGKAYSYYGTCVKNYVRKRREDYFEALKKKPVYEEIDERLSDTVSTNTVSARDKKIACEELDELQKRITTMVENPKSEGLKKNELKLGYGLISLLENWEDVIPSSVEKRSTNGKIYYVQPSEKLIRSCVMLFLKEQTGFDAKTIRNAMRKYRKEFLIIADRIIKMY